MSVDDDIETGELPKCLREEDWRYFTCYNHAANWDGWLEMWWGITWVRLQAIEREWNAEDVAADWHGL